MMSVSMSCLIMVVQIKQSNTCNFKFKALIKLLTNQSRALVMLYRLVGLVPRLF